MDTMPCELMVTQSKGKDIALEATIKPSEAHAPEPACGWLKATDAAKRGRYADASPYVTANSENGAASSDESPLSSRGTSRSLQDITGVHGLSEDGVTAIIAAKKKDIYINSVKLPVWFSNQIKLPYFTSVRIRKTAISV